MGVYYDISASRMFSLFNLINFVAIYVSRTSHIIFESIKEYFAIIFSYR